MSNQDEEIYRFGDDEDAHAAIVPASTLPWKVLLVDDAHEVPRWQNQTGKAPLPL
jgi:hypothetical protein